MKKGLIKDPYFIIGLSIIFIIFALSIIFTFVLHGKIPKMILLYNAHGELVDKAPLSPLEYPPLGTDREGYSMFFRLIIGAKYTIGITLIIAFLRLLISLVFGLIYGNFFIKFSRYVSKIIEAFNYVPTTLLAYILLAPVILENSVTNQYQYSSSQRIVFEIVILTVIALPTTSLMIGNETNYLLKEEFITSVKLLGGTKLYILKRHVLPHLVPKLWINFAQQIIQVLVLLIHLGLFHLFFGGTNVYYGLEGAEYSSQSGEWAGLIGTSFFNDLSTKPWIALDPLIMFSITLISMQLVLKALKVHFESGEHRVVSKKIKSKTKKGKFNITQNDFNYLN
jgi:peptide/nickel transport system permease protein